MRNVSEMVQEAEEWLSNFTCSFAIDQIVIKADDSAQIWYDEYADSEDGQSFITVTQNGEIINSNGENVVEVGLDAYKNDIFIVEWLRAFKEKWRAK